MSEPFLIGEACLCYHGPLLYEAKILKISVFDESNTPTGHVGAHYLVHYKGWKQTWDELVPENRLLKLNETNVATQRMLASAAAAASGSGSGGGGGSAGGGKAKSGGKENAAARRAKDVAAGGRGVKRAREEDTESTGQSPKKAEMRLNIPELLKAQLVDDWEYVTKNNQLVTLPRSPTVNELLEEFEQYVRRTKPPHLRDFNLLVHTIIPGLRIYFDRALGMQLLYRFERAQYAQVRKQYLTGSNIPSGQQKDMSSIYGAEHFLRMLVILPTLIAQSNLGQETVQVVKDYVEELMRYMENEKRRIFQVEYDVASLPYQNIMRS